MLFTSAEFFVLLIIVFALYWLLARWTKWQNALIVVASYVFYGWWDWRFLMLIAFTSFCSWGSGLLIGKAESRKKAKAWMWTNIVLNLGILALFKYYDFFVVEFAKLFHASTDGLLLKVILPVGIFFYFRMLRFRMRLYRDLRTIRHTSDRIITHIYNNKV